MTTPTGPRRGQMRPAQASQTNTSPTVPTGPSRASLPPHACRALDENGDECKSHVPNIEHHYCLYHHKEYTRLYNRYKQIGDEYDEMENGSDKIARGKTVLELRETVNLRFFSYPGADNRTHAQKILNVRAEVRRMEGVVDMVEERKVARLQEERKEQKKAQDAAREETVKKKKTGQEGAQPSSQAKPPPQSPPASYPAMAPSPQQRQLPSLASRRWRLYQAWPGLWDAYTVPQPSDKDLITRLLFRKLVALHASEEAWIRAMKTHRIEYFLLDSSEDEFVTYEQKLGEIANRTWSTFYLLRNAVCEFCADSPGTTGNTFSLLGGTVPASDRRDRLLKGRIMDVGKRKMTVRGWDLLYTNFCDIVTWKDLPRLSTCYDDFVAVKTLTILEAFGKRGDSSNNQPSTWYCPTDDLAVHSRVHRLLLNGFVTVATNCFGKEFVVAGPGQEIRRYIVGRMTKKSAALRFMAALRERTDDLISFCICPEEAKRDGFLDSLYDRVPMEDLWVARRRLFLNSTLQSWTEEKTLVGVLRDMHPQPTMPSPPSGVVPDDYYEIVIMSRSANPMQHVVDMVDMVFSAVNGTTLTTKELMRNVVAKYVPTKDKLLYHWRIRRLLVLLAPLTNAQTWVEPGFRPEPESTMRSPLLRTPRGTALRGTDGRQKTGSYLGMIWGFLSGW